jgi:hypothetical protein
MQELLALVPSDLQCSPGTNPVGSGLAEVDCQTGVNGIPELRYTLFPDQASLHGHVSSEPYGGFLACPGRGQSPLDWKSAANPQLEGTIGCYNYGGPAIEWSIDPQLVLGFVSGKSATMNQVYQWWAARYQ